MGLYDRCFNELHLSLYLFICPCCVPVMQGIMRTNSCQSDSSGFLEELSIPSLSQQVSQGSVLIKVSSLITQCISDYQLVYSEITVLFKDLHKLREFTQILRCDVTFFLSDFLSLFCVFPGSGRSESRKH